MTLFLTAVVCFAVGALLARAVLVSRYRKGLRALDAAMTRQIRVRYEAYLELESKVKRVIAEFDRRETGVSQLLERQKDTIRSLTQTVHGHISVLEVSAPEVLQHVESSDGEVGANAQADQTADSIVGQKKEQVVKMNDDVTSMGGWLFEQKENSNNSAASPNESVEEQVSEGEVYNFQSASHSQADEKSGGGEAMDMDLADFEQRLINVQRKKKAQLDEQSSLIAELTECVERLRPLPIVLEQREQELRNVKQRFEDFQRSSDEQISDRRRKVDELQSLLGKREERIQQLCYELEERGHTLQQAQDSVEGLKKVEFQQANEIEARGKEIDSLKSVTARRALELQDLTDAHAELNTVHGETRTQLEDARHELEVTCERLARSEEQVRDINGRFDELNELQGGTKDQLSKVQHNLSESRDQIESLRSQAASQEQEVQRRVTEVGILQDTYRELEAAKGSEIESLHVRMRELESFRSESKRLTERVGEMNVSLDQAEDRYEHLEETTSAKIKSLEESLELTEVDLKDTKSTLEDLNVKRDQLDEQLNTTTAELKDLRVVVQERDNEISQLTGNLSNSEESLTGQRSRIADLMQALEDAEGDLETKRSSLAGQAMTLDEAKAMVAQLRPTIETLEAKLVRYADAGSSSDSDSVELSEE